MLAVEADLDSIKFPLYASPKIDGLRILVSEGVAYSRNKKPFRNKYLQDQISKHQAIYNGIDGELIVGEPAAEDVFRKSTSGCMSEDGEPDFNILGFDRHDMAHLPYSERLSHVHKSVRMPTRLVNNFQELMQLESKFVDMGFEGIMVRSLDGPYKQGRSTVKEGYLLKIKRFVDDEAVIIGFEERLHNANEATTDLLGRTKRSSHKENLIPMGTLGALVLELRDGQLLNVGTGFTDDMRSQMWNNRESLLGKLCKFKYTTTGMKNLPRFPAYLGIRDPNDLDEKPIN